MIRLFIFVMLVVYGTVVITDHNYWNDYYADRVEWAGFVGATKDMKNFVAACPNDEKIEELSHYMTAAFAEVRYGRSNNEKFDLRWGEECRLATYRMRVDTRDTNSEEYRNQRESRPWYERIFITYDPQKGY